MKFPVIAAICMICSCTAKVAAQSDAQMSEYSMNFSKIVGFNITVEERIRQVEQYVPAVFFQKKGFNALSGAIGTRNIRFIEYILAKPGVNAAETGFANEGILNYLPWDYYKIVKPGTCAQSDTIAALRKQIALLLISKGASISISNTNGYNIMTKAVSNKDLDFLQFLFEKNGNRLVASPYLLYTACSSDCIDIVDWLLAHGENVNTPNKHEGSAIGSSVSNPALVRYLIGKGANVNQANGYGWTPLMYAVNRGNMESVQLLLDAGADVNAVNDKGWNALQVAKEYKQKDIGKLLKKKMGL